MTKFKLWMFAAITFCGTSLDVNAQDETPQVYFELNQLIVEAFAAKGVQAPALRVLNEKA